MLLWFLGISFAAVWLVFRSPMLDYRLVLLGSVLPIGELVLGGPRLAHTLTFAVAVMFVVMLATQKRRLVRRRWISLAIGLMMHLVLDGSWTQRALFWWPFFGWSFGEMQVPELSRGLAVTVLQEAIGVGVLAWCWVRFDLRDPVNRRLFLTTGHLNRDLAQ
ncbi:MAG: metal-dependent hydrolase [Acidimicrobiales bacterium]|nr:metal-dependent hydrolase [Acidimicrobiales bacterium]